jgi:hypothetical protein
MDAAAPAEQLILFIQDQRFKVVCLQPELLPSACRVELPHLSLYSWFHSIISFELLGHRPFDSLARSLLLLLVDIISF